MLPYTNHLEQQFAVLNNRKKLRWQCYPQKQYKLMSLALQNLHLLTLYLKTLVCIKCQNSLVIKSIFFTFSPFRINTKLWALLILFSTVDQVMLFCLLFHVYKYVLTLYANFFDKKGCWNLGEPSVRCYIMFVPILSRLLDNIDNFSWKQTSIKKVKCILCAVV